MKKHRKFTELLDQYLKDEEFAAEFLSQALEEENFSTFLLSLKDLMRVHGTIKPQNPIGFSRGSMSERIR